MVLCCWYCGRATKKSTFFAASLNNFLFQLSITNSNANNLLCEYIVAVGHGLVPGLEEAVQLHGSKSIQH